MPIKIISNPLFELLCEFTQGAIVPGSILVFLKHFDANEQTLLGVGSVYLDRNQTASELRALIKQRMCFPADTPLELFEVRFLLSSARLFVDVVQEIKPGMTERINAQLTAGALELQNGDIICFNVYADDW